MNIGMAADTPFGDRNGFLDFLLQNEVAHIAFQTALAQRGVTISTVLPVGNPMEHGSWMFDHWQRHIEESSSLGIAVPDLSGYNLHDAEQYADWMYQHGDLHRAQNEKLGITS